MLCKWHKNWKRYQKLANLFYYNTMKRIYPEDKLKFILEKAEQDCKNCKGTEFCKEYQK